MNTTPICLFVYNRPKETEAALASLSACRGADQHPLFIFSDGVKHPQADTAVKEVRNILHRPWPFLSIHYSESSVNRGLAKSIIEGVGKVLEQYEQVIVLEDDLVLSADFLEYMEQSLLTYRNDNRIWSISGYSPSIEIPADYEHQVYLTPRASSWGWGTWRNRWEGIDWEVSDYRQFRSSRKKRKAFDRGGNDMSRLLDLQQHGRINSWAIRWCYAQFLRNMYTVYPVKSKVANQGFGNNASHAGWHDDRHQVVLDSSPLEISPDLEPDGRIMDAFKAHQDLGIISKTGYFIRLHGLGYKFFQKILKLILHHQH